MTAQDFWETTRRNDGLGDFDSINSWTVGMARLLFRFAEKYHHEERLNEQKAKRQKLTDEHS